MGWAHLLDKLLNKWDKRQVYRLTYLFDSSLNKWDKTRLLNKKIELIIVR